MEQNETENNIEQNNEWPAPEDIPVAPIVRERKNNRKPPVPKSRKPAEEVRQSRLNNMAKARKQRDENKVSNYSFEEESESSDEELIIRQPEPEVKETKVKQIVKQIDNKNEDYDNLKREMIEMKKYLTIKQKKAKNKTRRAININVQPHQPQPQEVSKQLERTLMAFN